MRQPRGTYASKLAFSSIPTTILIGLWEVAHMVEVQQYPTHAAREGARQIQVSLID